MKRTFILIVALLFSATLCMAQNGMFFRNSFVSFGAGANYYSNKPGVTEAVAYGKWLLTSTGLRTSFSFNENFGTSGMDTYINGTVDIFFDPVTAIKGRNPSPKFRRYCLLGLGLVHKAGDNDFCCKLGLGCDMKISRDWRLFAELDALVLPSGFDNKNRTTAMGIATVGATYDIDFNPTGSRSRYETRDFRSDWFFQVALGACSFNYKGVGSFEERLSLITPVFEFGIGKRLTTTWTIRCNASGLYARSKEELYSFYNLRGDLMLDVCGWLMPDRRNPFFDVLPYLGASLVARLDDQRHFLLSAAGGMVFDFNINPRNSIYLDVRYLIPPSRFARVEESQTSYSVGLATVMVGYSYMFSHKSL